MLLEAQLRARRGTGKAAAWTVGRGPGRSMEGPSWGRWRRGCAFPRTHVQNTCKQDISKAFSGVGRERPVRKARRHRVGEVGCWGTGLEERPAMGWRDPRGSSPGGLHWRHLHTGTLLLLLFVCVWSRRGSLCPLFLRMPPLAAGEGTMVPPEFLS